MGLFDSFFKKNLDALVVKKYRAVGILKNCAPTKKTSDKKIVEIYKKVYLRFNEAAAKKGEFIPSKNVAHIALVFMQVYEMSGEKFMDEHLEYEILKYHMSGLRKDYTDNELSLFL
jgi:hypothetical protein